MKLEPLHTATWPAARPYVPAATAVDRWLLARLQAHIRPARLRLALWDGSAALALASPVATVTFRTRAALVGCALDPDLNFGEGYMAGAIAVDGDLCVALEEIYRASPPRPRPWWARGDANGIDAARANVHRHYDLGNQFYRLWLDGQLLYTCAYFETPEVSLEQAQTAKMDLVCRKLRLIAGERVVEAGCGWGALALHMAGRYGVRVRAFNVSSEQIAYARAAARRAGLDHQVEFVEDDYRNVTGRYDVFVSVGMLEHVGLADYETFGRVIDRALDPDGRGLLHFIGRNRPAPLNAWIRRRIFPGAYPPTLDEVVQRVCAPADLSVLHVDNLRLHYAKTLDHWSARFDRAAPTVEAMFDARFVRAWRLYLAGSRAAFVTGAMQLFQVVFARGTSNALPWPRVTG